MTREEALATMALVQRRTVSVIVPEWDKSIVVREMSAAERDAFDSAIYEDKQASRPMNFRARLCLYCLADEAGNRLFQDSDLPALSNQPMKVIRRLYDVAAKLNAIGEEEIAEMGKD